MQKLAKQSQGFSLIELSIVLGIMSIMATALIPNMIALHQEKLVTTTAKTYYNIADAALAYAQAKGHWPGFKSSEDACTSDVPDGQTPLNILHTAGYLPTSELRNPWHNDDDPAFSLNVETVEDSGNVTGCRLHITSTNFPASVGNMLNNLLPSALCTSDGEEQATHSCTTQMLDSVTQDSDHVTIVGTDTQMVNVAWLPGNNYHVWCPPGEVIVGFKYDDHGDAHISHMHCAPLRFEDYVPQGG